MLDFKNVCAKAPMVPVLTVEAVEDAVPLAQALGAGGLPVLEITLCTPVALRAIEAISAACPDAIVGAGTLRNAADVTSCIDAGAS
jgi:2-dehydro-3-deoxyphosphogluconate aldolase/(4S)-4-hydroxy-2-oxoglutarate aldolase